MSHHSIILFNFLATKHKALVTLLGQGNFRDWPCSFRLALAIFDLGDSIVVLLV